MAHHLEMLVAQNTGRRAISTPEINELFMISGPALWDPPEIQLRTRHGIVLVDVEQRNLLKALPVLRIHAP